MVVCGSLLVLLCCLAGSQSLAFKDEPSCTVTSRFDFEEKLLEKLVRMELLTETLKTQMETDLNNFAKELRKTKAKIDTSVNDVETLERKVAAKLVEVDTTIDEATSTMKQDIDSYKTNAVAFHVQDVVGQPGPSSTISFKTTLENTGQAYNLDTGCFTAPMKGTYWFAAHVCSKPNTHILPSIIIRGNLAATGYSYDNNYVQCSTVNAVSVLQAGDAVCLKASPKSSSSAVYTSPHYLTNDFMGARVN